MQDFTNVFAPEYMREEGITDANDYRTCTPHGSFDLNFRIQ